MVIRTHRAAYQAAHPDENIDDFQIKLTCGRRRCINPAHLVRGLSKLELPPEKNAVAIANRPHGETHGRSKLDWEAVRYIRSTVDKDGTLTVSASLMASHFGVSRGLIYAVLRGDIWQDDAPEVA